MKDYSYVNNAHPSYIEALYQQYQQAPASLDEGWRVFFDGFEFAADASNGSGAGASLPTDVDIVRETKVLSIIKAFRNRGHLESTTNPIRPRRNRTPYLNFADFGLSEADLDTHFYVSAEVGLSHATLRQIIERLSHIYCGNIGFEFEHIQSREKRRWLRERIERRMVEGFNFDAAKKRRILEKLNGSEIFERFLHTKYVGQKRFSLEGGESTIPGLDAAINLAAELGVEEVVIGMAHRGRLNVLANIMGKTYEHIFNEFEGNVEPNLSYGDGDVKYHLGYSSQVTTPGGKMMHLKLAPNPSHLESVNPVVEGFARAKADLLYGSDYSRILPILIHGDAAVAGQGIVYETVQMSQLEGYKTGGTLHFVINNQVGFTTDFDDARSSTYSTGVAHVVHAPVFHVNGDDPEAVVFACELAMEYRQAFKGDVFVDMVCYRKHGHNEGDDPQFTQPEMYKFIKDHKNPRELYSEALVSHGAMDKTLAEQLEKEFWDTLQARLDLVREKPLPYVYQEPEVAWRSLKKMADTTIDDYFPSQGTGIGLDEANSILEHLMRLPADFTPLGKFNRLLKGMRKAKDDNRLDWAMGELMAYGSLLKAGHNVRISGQDVKRGTFSHRHAVLYDEKTYKPYNRLTGLAPDQGQFMIYNSLLSEFAVLGFEYGYSLASPDNLVIWEAQFGDFYNGAQTIVDQYISAAESKWQRMSGLVMLLPHGYEGQGPEHSSARLERFLQLCAEFNMSVCNISKPANLFHALRRQLARPFRKPLIIMSPKSLLRHPECVSGIEEFGPGTRFHEVYDDLEIADAGQVKRVLFCTGKIYYDLLAKKHESGRQDVAIVRLEQLYPFPDQELNYLIEDKYKGAKLMWVQEEPSNMGAWQYILAFYRNYDIQLVSRKSSASPATGYKKVHDNEQKRIVEEAFA